jgi:hypothetical protein
MTNIKHGATPGRVTSIKNNATAPVTLSTKVKKAPRPPSVPAQQSCIFIPTDKETHASTSRTKHAIPKPLAAFIANELRPWSTTFPAEFYEELFRLYRLPCPPAGKKSCRPGFFGHITNDVIYSRIAPDLLPELKKAATRSERKARLHQWLTQESGYLKLREHLASIIAILKLSSTPESFKANVNFVHPRKGDTLPLDFGDAFPAPLVA